ncbi:uncharacterized protein G2W53_029026 [Senna tora]|uniref:Uncharacterized protein n=1 Tax=Senna tora TaxID=362788 RepID=A0A834T6Y7_9FABA|nr:uncharacterized protein G2W53_029026 [Senna tora]
MRSPFCGRSGISGNNGKLWNHITIEANLCSDNGLISKFGYLHLRGTIASVLKTSEIKSLANKCAEHAVEIKSLKTLACIPLSLKGLMSLSFPGLVLLIEPFILRLKILGHRPVGPSGSNTILEFVWLSARLLVYNIVGP